MAAPPCHLPHPPPTSVPPSLRAPSPPGSPLPVLTTSANTLPGDLLAVLPPLGFASGGFQEVPELEDLHAAMIEDGLKPAQRRVLTLLESLRPPPPGPETPTSPSPSPSPSTPAAPLPSLATLDPKFWSNRGKDTLAPEFSSKRLMSLLGRTAISSDAQDPAASQTRHEKPLGYVGLWPEAALLAHSCVPNTSQVVVGDRLFLHSIGELPRGTPLTRNQIGEVVTSPLAMRQEAVAELMEELGVTGEQLRAHVAAGAAAEGAVGEAGEELLTACRWDGGAGQGAICVQRQKVHWGGSIGLFATMHNGTCDDAVSSPAAQQSYQRRNP